MEIPIHEAVFEEADPRLGLRFLSLVSKPAIEVTWIKFSEEQEVKLAIQDEEKMQFLTPVLIPGQKILRKDDAGNPYWLVFRAETIRQIAYDWQLKNLSSNVDMEHSRQLIQGVNYCETFLSSENTISSVKGFESLPLGTWYVVGRAMTPEAWQPIKDGIVKGVSIDGFFKQREKLCSDELVKSLIKKLYNS